MFSLIETGCLFAYKFRSALQTVADPDLELRGVGGLVALTDFLPSVF